MKKLLATLLLPLFAFAGQTCALSGAYTWGNNIPPRIQWHANGGYCGEVSLISAGLYYGQYVSQYDVRALLGDQSVQLLIGVNDQTAAQLMHLNSIEWDTDDEDNTHDFMAWIKQNVVQGFPVAIGIYINESFFDHTRGDPDYDHIVPVTGIDSNHALNDPNYYADDVIHFSDNGIWQPSNPPCNFCYAFAPFQDTRKRANNKSGPLYSVTDDASNYGIAITGVMDLNGETLPVRVDTNLNYENPPIASGSNARPAPAPLTLTITLSNLEPGIPYVLYRYNSLSSVPNSSFNGNAGNAYEMWPVQIDSGTTYVMTETINSDEIAVYRAIKASAP